MNDKKKKVMALASLTGLAIMGDAMLLIVLPIYWMDFGLTSIWQVGVLLSVNRFIRLPINPLVGWLYSKYSLRLGIAIALILAAISTFSYGIIQHFYLLLIMRMLWGIAWSLLRLGGYLSIVNLSTDQDRGQLIGLYNGTWGIGSLIGMLVGGFLIEFVTLFWICTVFSLLCSCSLLLIRKHIPANIGNNTTTSGKLQRSSFKITKEALLVLTTSTVMGLLIFGLFSSTLSLLIDLNYQGNLTVLSLTLSASAIASVIQAIRWAWDPILAPAVGRYLDHTKSKKQFLVTALICLAILFSVLTRSIPLQWLIIILLLFQILSTSFVTTTDTLASSFAARKKSVSIMTLHTVLVDLGAALGPLLAFNLLEISSLATVYLLAGIVLIGLAVGWLVKFDKRTLDSN
ncbi:MFS transporter [Amphibacillus marinus]|nr:MFS transporter [Amphibacillus marinus]